jgi:hypothetical protein
MRQLLRERELLGPTGAAAREREDRERKFKVAAISIVAASRLPLQQSQGRLAPGLRTAGYRVELDGPLEEIGLALSRQSPGKFACMQRSQRGAAGLSGETVSVSRRSERSITRICCTAIHRLCATPYRLSTLNRVPSGRAPCSVRNPPLASTPPNVSALIHLG